MESEAQAACRKGRALGPVPHPAGLRHRHRIWSVDPLNMQKSCTEHPLYAAFLVFA